MLKPNVDQDLILAAIVATAELSTLREADIRLLQENFDLPVGYSSSEIVDAIASVDFVHIVKELASLREDRRKFREAVTQIGEWCD